MSSERLQRSEPIKRVTLKDGRVRYRVIVDAGRDEAGRRRQVCSTHDTLKEARLALSKTRTDVGAGRYVTRHTVTVSEYLETWLAGRHNLKATTLVGYRSDLSPVMGAYGTLPLQSLTKAHLDALVRKMLAEGGRKGLGRSPRTVTVMLVVLRHALEDAKNNSLINRNPAAMVDSPKADNTGVKGQAWTDQQARDFLAHVSRDRLSAAWRLALYGLRRGEVLGLSWDDIDLEASEATISSTRVVAGRQVVTSSTKNRKARRVPVGSEVVADLRVLKALQARERLAAGPAYTNSGLVVVNEIGRPMRPETFSNQFHVHAAAAGLPRIRLHDLRHTAASLMAAAGVPIVTAAALLGHDPMVFSTTYAHHYSDEVRGASDVLSRVYRQAR